MYGTSATRHRARERTFLIEMVRQLLQIPYQKSHFEIIGIAYQKRSESKTWELILFFRKHALRVHIKVKILSRVKKFLPAYSFEVRR